VQAPTKRSASTSLHNYKVFADKGHRVNAVTPSHLTGLVALARW
jgi:hypothetical protein